MKNYCDKTRKTGLVLLLLLTGLSFSSCVDTDPEEVLDYEDFYTNLDDADAAILGLYGQFMELLPQVVVLNELRGDLMDVTPNATTHLQEIALNRASKDNPWSNVSNFYKVIQTCNDVLDNFDKMLIDKTMTQAEYDERYSDVAALRCWIYLQLGIHFGKVPYITAPIVPIDDLNQYKNNELELNDLINELILCMENLPLEQYQNSKLIQSSLDGYSLTPFFVHKRCLLGDLYLFADRYLDAATIYRQVLSANEDAAATNNQYMYRLYTYTTGFTGYNYQVLYTRGKEEDADALQNYWISMFYGTGSVSSELIWYCTYDQKYSDYSLSKLFTEEYQLKPSAYAVEYLWENEEQKNGFPYDARGLNGGYLKSGENAYIYKYAYYPLVSTSVAGQWYLYRAAMLHLRYAEAANRCGYPLLAWALVNNGIGSNYVYTREDGTEYPSDSIRYTGYSPTQPYPAPFYFDARQNQNDSRQAPNAPWRYNGGVRGRANLPNVDFPATCVTQKDSILFVEKLIAHEAALELGFEGHRWADLIRIARRLNKENPGAGNRFLWDENLAKKYEQSGESADLSSENKWFLELYK